MTQQAEVLDIAPREVIENEPVTTSTVRLFEVWSNRPADPTPEQSMRIVEVSGSLDFWLNPAEDIYGPDDGTPV